jgi:hypothetical protein
MVSEKENLAENTINGCQIGNMGETSSISKKNQSKWAFNVSQVLKGELQASVQNVRIVKSPRAGIGNVANADSLATEMW